jgi:cob(I)alamin adenosyltransferase
VKIYTKTGDGGETGLGDGSRVSKDDPRVAAYGEVDELNAVLGLARAQGPDPETDALLLGVQKDLFALGAQLADPSETVAARKAKAAVPQGRVAELENAIDRRELALPPLRAFVLPGGTALGATLHLARTVCRRAERSIVSLSREGAVDPVIEVYVNRLSDLLFVLARHANQSAGRSEDTW